MFKSVSSKSSSNQGLQSAHGSPNSINETPQQKPPRIKIQGKSTAYTQSRADGPLGDQVSAHQYGKKPLYILPSQVGGSPPSTTTSFQSVTNAQQQHLQQKLQPQNVAMDDIAVTTKGQALATDGVCDCLAIVLHDTTRPAGALAHISAPRAMQGNTGNDQLKILSHVNKELTKMATQLGSPPENLEVTFWRGSSFGSKNPLMGNLSVAELIQESNTNQFRNVFDMTEKPGVTLPYHAKKGMIYDPKTGDVFFTDG